MQHERQVPMPVLDWRDASGPIDYPLTNDYMFRMVLQTNEAVLRGLISSLLHIPLEEIRQVVIENPILPGTSMDAKTFILDICICMNDDSLINLEMQLTNLHNWPNRSLSYLCRTYDSLQRGEDYESAASVTHVGLLDYDLFPESPEFYAQYKMMNVRTHEIYNDKFALNVLSLRQTERATEEDRQWHIDEWATLFCARTWEDLKMLAENREVYAEAASSLYYQNSDRTIREMCEAREEAIRHEERMKQKIKEAEEEAIRHEERMKQKIKEAEEEVIRHEERMKLKLAEVAQREESMKRQLEEAEEEAIRHEEQMKQEIQEATRREAELEKEVRQLRAQLQALQSEQS